MLIKTLIKTSQYFDSVSLMLVGRELADLPGVEDAGVIMGTDANKAILSEAGLLAESAFSAGPNDLVISVRAVDETSADRALQAAEEFLKKKNTDSHADAFNPKTLRGAVKANPQANLAVISVAGRYAADQAWEALHLGLHVLLFSDNVSLADEIALKQYAGEHGLLLMGPGAGTAILNGVALGFANVLPSGPVGIVSAAGTGLQEVSTLLARQDIGITQGIGTGGRDLKAEVGGLMMLAGLQALQEDPDTEIILLVSKPPAAVVAEKILAQAALAEKPCVVCFLGAKVLPPPERFDAANRTGKTILFASTLQEAAILTARLAGAPIPDPETLLAEEGEKLNMRAEELRGRLVPGQHYLRGLFSGGTLCYESQVIWQELLTEPVYSNAPLSAEKQLPDSSRSLRHSAVDLGEEEFTVGRPHPMIDNDLRMRRLLQEAKDPETAVILFDVVLGYGAHPDPASELGQAVKKARGLAAETGRDLIFIASVTGTEADPQRLSRQVQALEDSGVAICDSNAAAARLAAYLLQKIAG